MDDDVVRKEQHETQGKDLKPETAAKNERIISIDALRGFDMFFLMWGTGLFGAFFMWVYPPFGEFLTIQFEHVEWNGFHFYDLIFPLFLFISGISIPFSITKRLERGDDKADLYRHAFSRAFWLFLMGFLKNNLDSLFMPSEWRWAGVLQRFAICGLITSLIIMNFDKKKQFYIFMGILLGYWGIMSLVPVPGFGSGIFTPEANLAGYVDRLLLPNPNSWCCYIYGDSEGILSTIPAIGTCLLGTLTGNWMRMEYTPIKKFKGLVESGVILLGIGLFWGIVFPINKYMWTSSFVCLTGGLSILLLAIFYGIIDILQLKTGSKFFTIIGMNSILIYFASGYIGLVFIFGFFESAIKKRAYKKIQFWILPILLVVLASLILGLPGWLDSLISIINQISNNGLLGSLIWFIYGYGSLVFCYKKKWFLKI
jgi:predicted acyltransferase